MNNKNGQTGRSPKTKNQQLKIACPSQIKKIGEGTNNIGKADSPQCLK